YPIQISGDFGYHTVLDVQAFQSAHGLTPDGVIGPATWAAILRYRVARVRWSVSQPRDTATVTSAAITAQRASSTTLAEPVPASALLPPTRNEIAHAGGAGHPC